jgi:hypothetical protein
MKTIAILSIAFFSLFAHNVKRDYISFECAGPVDMVSKNVIYLSKEPISGSEQVGSFDYSPSPLNYTISDRAFLFIKNTINLTSKEKFQGKDSIGIIVKIRKNNTIVSYFIAMSNARSMFENFVYYLNKHKGDTDLIMDLNNLNWTKLPTYGVKNDNIRIEYVGDANKPMYVIWISKNPLPESQMIITIEYDQQWYDYTVHDDEYLFINNVINSTTHKIFQEKDYNGFKITIHENAAETYYFIKRKNSDSFFLKTIAFLKHRKRNKDLIQYLNILRLGNVFDDSGNYVGGYY